MSAFCVTRPRPFSLSRERSAISKQMPRHDGLGHASLLGVLGDRLAFLHNDGEQQVDVLKWHGGPQCPEGLHKARLPSAPICLRRSGCQAADANHPLSEYMS